MVVEIFAGAGNVQSPHINQQKNPTFKKLPTLFTCWDLSEVFRLSAFTLHRELYMGFSPVLALHYAELILPC